MTTPGSAPTSEDKTSASSGSIALAASSTSALLLSNAWGDTCFRLGKETQPGQAALTRLARKARITRAIAFDSRAARQLTRALATIRGDGRRRMRLSMRTL